MSTDNIYIYILYIYMCCGEGGGLGGGGVGVRTEEYHNIFGAVFHTSPNFHYIHPAT